MQKPIISADSHVAEPPNCYLDFIDARFRDRAPRMYHDPKRGDMFQIEGSRTPLPMAFISAAGVPPEQMRAKGVRFEDLHRGGWDPEARLADQDRDGISAEIIYPSVGMEICNISDHELKQACMEAYNRWLAGYCAPHPERLIGLGQCAVRSPETGIKELEAIKRHGFKGVMLPGFPAQEDYAHEMYREFFDAMVDLDLVPSFHILTSGEFAQRHRGSSMNSFMSVVRSNQEIMSMFVFDGVFMRHPRLKLVSAEADGGWIPHYMYRMDHAYNRHRHRMRGRELEKAPSEYFREHIYFTFQDDYIAFKYKDDLNIERMMWANDFPHSDSTWPWSQELLKKHLAHMTTAERNLILHDNVAKLYGLDTRELAAAA